MTTLADRIILFYNTLDYKGSLPDGVSVMNPFREKRELIPVIEAFYHKYFSDNRLRRMIIGINPGRFGAGATGLPFTDTIRLESKCGLSIPGIRTFEPSSVFIYDMIEKYGGVERFYGDYYFSSVSPLGFTRAGPGGNMINYNYYDSRELTEAIIDFAVESMRIQLTFGIDTEIAFCLGTGKNFRFLSELNDKYRFFKKIEPLEHPRFIMQYRLKRKEYFIDKYIEKLQIL